MKLWLLRTNRAVGYDRYIGFVVMAETGKQARELAQKADKDGAWLNRKATTCKTIRIGKEPKILLESFNAG